MGKTNTSNKYNNIKKYLNFLNFFFPQINKIIVICKKFGNFFGLKEKKKKRALQKDDIFFLIKQLFFSIDFILVFGFVGFIFTRTIFFIKNEKKISVVIFFYFYIGFFSFVLSILVLFFT